MKQIFYLLVFSMISFSSMGEVTDFSGTWNLNKAKSTLNDQFSMAPNQLILTQDAAVFAVERHASFQGQDFTINDKFTLDGKECINAGWQDMEKKSTAEWSADEKSLIISSKIMMQDGGELKITETFQTEENNLKITVSASSSYGDVTETYLFDKQK